MFLGKGVLKICSKFTGEHRCRSAISIKSQSNFIEIALWHGCSPVNLQNIFRTPFLKNTSGRLLLILFSKKKSELVPLRFISHSKLYNDKNVLQDIKVKVKKVHGIERNVVFFGCVFRFSFISHIFQY